MVVFLDKPAERDGFHEIIDFLNANQIRYALTVNPLSTILHSTVSVISIGDAGGTDYLTTATFLMELNGKIGLIKMRVRFKLPNMILTRYPLLLNHHPLDLRRNSPGGNRGRTLQLLRRIHNKMTVFLHLPMIHLSVRRQKECSSKEIADLKKRVQKLERQKKSRTTGLKRLRKVGMSRRVESSKDKDSLGDHEDASKQGRSIEDIDKDADVSLVDDTQGEREVNTVVEDSAAPTIKVSTADEGVTAAKIDELTLAQTLIEIKAAKPKVVIPTATTTTTTRPKARGVVVQEPSEFRTPQEAQSSSFKDKGKAIMIEPKLEAELLEEEKLARKQEEEANIALIESWDNTQAMMEEDFELAQKLQTEEQGEITIEERSRLFIELMNKRKKHFAMIRAEEKRRKPPTKAQKRNQMSTYLKNMGGYKHNQLKSKSYEEIQKLFDNEMRRVNTFKPMDSEVVKSKKETEESSKGIGDELEADKLKAESSEEKAKGSRKKMLEDEVDGEVELKKHLVIVKDDEIAIDAISLATKPPVIVEYKPLKEGIMVHYQLIRADGSSKRYS
ncbi:hypothetical protein Tco_0132213 [Tanacetum coccineum]